MDSRRYFYGWQTVLLMACAIVPWARAWQLGMSGKVKEVKKKNGNAERDLAWERVFFLSYISWSAC